MKDWLNLKETCAMLGLSANTVKRLVDEGILQAYEIKGVQGLRYKKQDVEALITPTQVNPGKKRTKKAKR